MDFLLTPFEIKYAKSEVAGGNRNYVLAHRQYCCNYTSAHHDYIITITIK
eukprot:m.168063 g.168063  ORF g.168063 m.168063 type:complete len:50 (-) comp31489_c1_seq1:69-218(-)